MEIFEIRKQINMAIQERNTLEKELIKSRLKITKGSLIVRYSKCGKENCRCKTEGKKHGPFYFISKNINGKTQLQYIKKEQTKLINELTRYKRYEDNLARVRKLNKQINNLLNDLREGLIKC